MSSKGLIRKLQQLEERENQGEIERRLERHKKRGTSRSRSRGTSRDRSRSSRVTLPNNKTLKLHTHIPKTASREGKRKKKRRFSRLEREKLHWPYNNRENLTYAPRPPRRYQFDDHHLSVIKSPVIDKPSPSRDRQEHGKISNADLEQLNMYVQRKEEKERERREKMGRREE